MLDITPDLESEPGKRECKTGAEDQTFSSSPRDKLDKLFPLLLLAMKANEVNPEA